MDKRWMRIGGWVLVGAVLSGCALRSPWNRDQTVLVADAGVAINCPASGPEPWVREFPTLDAVRTWQVEQGLDLLTPGAEAGRYAVVGMGQRNTGGYGIAVSREATLAEQVLRLKATFVAPSGGGMTTQMFTSPCALVRLPRDAAWQTLQVYDQTGRLRVTLASP